MEHISIENKSGKVRLNESVNPDSMSRLIDEIDQVFGARAAAQGLVCGEITNCIENAADTLDIEIHSPGGSVLDGYKLYHAILNLRERGVHVTATINSLAASMASVIAMAADKIRMVKGGRMMIHEASQFVGGNAEELARAAKVLDEISGEIADIYAGRTGSPSAEMRALMKKETWMGAEEALKRKFIDEIAGGKFDTKKNEMANILDRLTSPASAEAIAKIEALENAAQAHESQLSELNAKLSTAESALQEAATATAELRTSLTTATEKVTALEAKAATDAATILDLTEKASHTKEKVDLEAGRQVAALGLNKPLETDGPDETGAVSKTPHLDKFNSLKGEERTAYYNENSTAIRAEQSA